MRKLNSILKNCFKNIFYYLNGIQYRATRFEYYFKTIKNFNSILI